MRLVSRETSRLLRLFCLFETTFGGANKAENEVVSRYSHPVIRIILMISIKNQCPKVGKILQKVMVFRKLFSEYLLALCLFPKYANDGLKKDVVLPIVHLESNMLF